MKTCDRSAPVAKNPDTHCLRTFPLPMAAMLAVMLLGMVGCAHGPRALDYRAATARAMASSAYGNPSSRSQTLAAMDVVTVASIAGEPRAITEALGVIEENAGAERGALAGAISMATVEGARRYIGETYERAYASIVGGWAYWVLGQHENAAALWRNAAMIDRESDEGYREDFGAANYLLARWYWRKGGAGDRKNSEIFTERLLAVQPNARPFANPEAYEKHNLVVLVENGFGPRKLATGPQGSILEYSEGEPDFPYATVRIDGLQAGRTVAILDMRDQAVHSLRPTAKVIWQAMRGTAVAGAVGYGVYKLTDDPALGVFAAAFLQLLPADLRQWRGVPAQLHVFSAQVPPGIHDIRIEAVSGWGQTGRLFAEYVSVPVGIERETILLVRMVPGVEKRSLPALTLRPTLAPDRRAPADPRATVVFPSAINPEDWEKSPLYRYLPPPATPAEKAQLRRDEEESAESAPTTP